MAITKEMQKELAGLARAANRRLERASEGQRAALDYYMRQYHTRMRGEMRVFQQGKAKTEAEYKARMKELHQFMDPAPKRDEDGNIIMKDGEIVYQEKISTRKGWERVKMENAKQAAALARADGLDITDEEMASLLKELDEGHSSAEYYKALENVAIAKNIAGSSWEFSDERIKEAMYSRYTSQQRAEFLIHARKG